MALIPIYDSNGDTGAFLEYLAAQSDVKAGGIGTTGYCMGGLMSLTKFRISSNLQISKGFLHDSSVDQDALLK